MTPELEQNLARLLTAVNRFRLLYGKPLAVSSGYRPGRYNEAAHGAPDSTHLVCMAVDLRDPDGQLDAFCLSHPEALEQCGLWQESPANTPGWTHLDIRPRKNRVFTP